MKKTKKNNNKLLLGVFLILILLLVGIFQINSQKKISSNKYTYKIPSPTVIIDKKTGWIIYKDKRRDFTLQYPVDWKMESRNESLIVSSPNERIKGAGEIETGGSLRILTFDKDAFINAEKKSSPEEILMQKYSWFKANATESTILPDPKLIKVNKYIAISYNELSWGVSKTKVVMLYANDTIFKFTCFTSEKEASFINDTCSRITNTLTVNN